MYHGEKFNSISHLVGAALSLVGVSVMMTLAVQSGDPWRMVSVAVYGFMMFFMYLSSTLYHSVQGAAKPVLRKMDHVAIYLMIAGSYTPFALIKLRAGMGWMLLVAVWVMAGLGILQEFFLKSKSRIFSVVLYVLMGWLIVFALKPLTEALSTSGLVWLVAGGLLYTGGILFYAFDSKLKHGHGIWHLFVLGGSLCHYFSILIL